MRILYVVPYVPSATRNRSFGFIRALSGLGHHVHVVALRAPEDAWAPLDAVGSQCARLEVFDLSRRQTLFNALDALPRRLPLQAGYGRHAEACQRVRHLAASGRFDVLHVEHLRGVLLAKGVDSLPTLFDAVDSISLLFDHTARDAPGWRQRAMARMDLTRTKRFEATAPFLFDRMVVTASRDRDAFVDLAGPGAGARIAVVSNGVALDVAVAPEAAHPPIVLFSGKMSYHANAAGAQLLATAIMPRVWQSHPEARLVIAGKDPSPGLRELSRDPRIEVTGFVTDLPALIGRAAVAIAPLPYAVGVQNKVLEAMACGVPVVASRVAAFGIDALDGRDWLVGDNPENLSAAVIKLLDEPATRAAVGSSGRRFVERHHQWSVCAGRLVEEYGRARDAHQRLSSAIAS
jgi:glycosyltransferase involved in cell wall biosynthesis